MLKNIPKMISPQLLKVLCEMGHGDEIVIADGNFPSESVGADAIVIRMDGHNCVDVLESILELFPLDISSDKCAAVMAADTPYKPEIWRNFQKILQIYGYNKPCEEIERFDFYERARKAYCIVATGENMLYANLIIKKGTI